MARIYRLKAREIARNRRVWMGIDAHKESWSITIVDRERIVYQDSCESKRVHLESMVERLPGCAVEEVYEAGPTGYKLVTWLRELGCEAFMTAPSLVPVQSGNRVKTDRRDSVKLPELLRAGLLEPVSELSEKTYQDRELLRTREQLMQHRSDICGGGGIVDRPPGSEKSLGTAQRTPPAHRVSPRFGRWCAGARSVFVVDVALQVGAAVHGADAREPTAGDGVPLQPGVSVPQVDPPVRFNLRGSCGRRGGVWLRCPGR